MFIKINNLLLNLNEVNCIHKVSPLEIKVYLKNSDQIKLPFDCENDIENYWEKLSQYLCAPEYKTCTIPASFKMENYSDIIAGKV